MMKSLWSGVNGVKTQNLGVDITANNISNVNTVGFKRTSSEFADIFYQRIISKSANPAEVGNGSLLSASKVVYEQGSFMTGEGEFDVALNGKGFFGVQGVGNVYYTRNGEFVRDGNNYLVDSSGNFVLGTMNPNFASVQFSTRVAEAMGRYNGTNTPVTEGYTINNPSEDFSLSQSSMQTRLFVPNTNMYYYPEVTTQATFKGTINPSKATTTIRTGLGTTYTDDTDTTQQIATIKPTSVSVTFGGTMPAGQQAAQGDTVEVVLSDGNTPENTLTYQATLDANLNFTGTIVLPDTFDATNIKVNSATLKKTDGTSQTLTEAEFPTLAKSATTGNITGNLTNAKGSDGSDITLNNGDRVVLVLTDKNGNTFTTSEATLDDTAKTFSFTGLNQANFDMASAEISSITLVGERTTYEDKAFGVRVYNLDGSVSSLKYNLSLANTTRGDNDNYIYDVVAGIYDDNNALIGTESRGTITFNQYGALIGNTLTSVPNPQGGAIAINFGTPTNTPSTNRTGAGWDGVYIYTDSNTDTITSSGDGAAEGFFSQYSISRDGSLMVQFSNGKSVTVGKLAIYSFINEQGLASVGGNNFMATSNSGAASFLYDDNGNLILPAIFVGQQLEMSNTDLSTELTNLIVMQRGFEASSKSITTSDDMLQTAIGLKK